MLANRWCGVLAQGVEHTHGVCFVDHAGDFFGCGPLETGYLVVGRQFATEDPAAENEGDDSTVHVLIDAGQDNRLNGEPSLLADFATYTCMDGLAEFEDSAWGLPVEVVSPPDEQRSVVVIYYYTCHADRVTGALWAHLITSGYAN
jgi:hypothetical protein